MNIIAKIKVNKQFGDHKPGTIVDVDCDETGIPLNHIWRRRLKDAETDNCCEIVKPKPKSKPKSESTSSKNEG